MHLTKYSGVKCGIVTNISLDLFIGLEVNGYNISPIPYSSSSSLRYSRSYSIFESIKLYICYLPSDDFVKFVAIIVKSGLFNI